MVLLFNKVQDQTHNKVEYLSVQETVFAVSERHEAVCEVSKVEGRVEAWRDKSEIFKRKGGQ